MAANTLERLREAVWQERELRDALWGGGDAQEFIQRLLEAARARGLELSEQELRQATQDGRHAAMERHQCR